MSQATNEIWGRCQPHDHWKQPRTSPIRRKRRRVREWAELKTDRLTLKLVETIEFAWGEIEDTPLVSSGVSQQNAVMPRLEEAAATGNEAAFLTIIREIEWQHISSNNFARAINLAIKVGLPLAARHISAEGIKYYPDELSIQKYARLLAPATVVSSKLHIVPDQRANMAWLKAQGGAHQGKWVALREGQLLGVEDTLKELVRKLGDTTNVMLTPAY